MNYLLEETTVLFGGGVIMMIHSSAEVKAENKNRIKYNLFAGVLLIQKMIM